MIYISVAMVSFGYLLRNCQQTTGKLKAEGALLFEAKIALKEIVFIYFHGILVVEDDLSAYSNKIERNIFTCIFLFIVV